MAPITGNAFNILERLPHFYNPHEVSEQLRQLINVFGRRLGRADTDLYDVLYAHHVETAENEGSKGYTAPPAKRGDLDKILALYLEFLGGTSQLVAVKPQFTIRSFDTRALARTFVSDQSPLTAYLRKHFAADSWTLLQRYQSTHAHIKPAEIQLSLVQALTQNQSSLAKWLMGHLSTSTQKLLKSHTGAGPVVATLPKTVATEFNQRILNNLRLFPANAAYLQRLTLPDAAWPLLYGIYPDYWRAQAKATKDPAKRKQLLTLLNNTEVIESPIGEDTLRLNRLLLEAAFPYNASTRSWGLRLRQIPTLSTVRTLLAKELNRVLTRTDLYSTERFPGLAESYPALQKQHSKQPAWLNRILLESAFPLEIEKSVASYRDRLLGIMRVLQEGASTRQGVLDIVAANLGILGDLADARAARTLIKIEEFSPQQKLVYQGRPLFYETLQLHNQSPESVDPQVRITVTKDFHFQALANLRIIDVAAGHQATFKQPLKAGDQLVLEGKRATVNGRSAVDPVGGAVPKLAPGTGRWWIEADVVNFPPGRFDTASSRFESASLGSAEIAAAQKRAGQQSKEKVDPKLPEGAFNTLYGKFDQTRFTTVGTAQQSGHRIIAMSRFDTSTGVYNQSRFGVESVIQVEVRVPHYTPGIFTVTIPWHIPGFTDKFAETADHPRHQILSLVNKVRGAGIQAFVSYRQPFAETHELSERLLALQLEGPALQSEAEMQERFQLDSRQSSQETHEMSDSLTLAGRLNLTRFDSLNRFA